MTKHRLRKPLSYTIACVALAGAAAAALPAFAHRDVERTPEVWSADERLLVVDSESGDIVVLDDGREVERLSTPPAPISLARSDDGRHALALRGRNTDRDHVTVIETAYDENTGEARRPFVARTFLADAPGGVSSGSLPEFAGGIGVAEEGSGVLTVIDPDEISGLGDASAGQIELAGPDHYAIVTGSTASGREVLHIGHLRAGAVEVLDADSGERLTWHGGCPGLHGGTADASGTKALFGCGNGVLTVPIDPDSDDTPRLTPYPAEGRVASFHRGKDEVLWGSTEGAQPAIHRIDTSAAIPEITRVDLAERSGTRTAIRTGTTPDGGYLLVLTHQGFLQIRDGADGTLLREVQLGHRFDPDFHEHVDRAEAPDFAATSGHVHVSIPDAGRVMTVDLARGRTINKVKIDGMPTRMVLLTHTR